ncbi:MAG TPA: MBL fold metallo-hydrolase [Bryobacteraceae bacterium]|nr:MBL fold metallo-hydrolase [Bryobacteraceae bacterium]
MKLRVALLALLCAPMFAASNDLTAYFIDVEGGQSTLFVTPTGQSVLVDAGWPGFNGRDADRIAAVAKDAGIKQIDYFLLTHFHVDHAGGVPALAEKLPIKTFIDHGDAVEHDPNGQKLFDAYQKEVAKAKHIVVKPGDKLPIKGLNWTIVSAGGNVIDKPLPGAGQANPDCASFKKRDIRDDENGQSVGSFIQYGQFKTIDLGDLLWNKEEGLMCPAAKVPPVEVYIVSHHGMNMSGSAALVHGLHPKVAIMDNGARKGGTAEAWDTVHSVPGIQDIWQLHFAVAGGPEHNSPENVIANMQQNPDSGNYLKLVAHKDGHFEVTNGRNGYSKKY